MKFAIFTIVEHKEYEGNYFGYAPYIREMNIWGSYVDEIIVLGPKAKSQEITAIDLPYEHPKIKYVLVSNFNIQSLFAIIKTVFIIPTIFFKILFVMRGADHLHLRCPGNIGLLACIAQIFFPNKKKTTKYAGNWDPKSNQPFTYRMQKWILSNTFLTKNMQVLVYGDWHNQSKNIKPFTSATYSINEIKIWESKDYTRTLNFVFAGSLVVGKRPLLSVQIVEALNKAGKKVKLHMFGDGNLMEMIKSYVLENKLDKIVYMHGNVDKDIIKETLYEAHFSILPSKSEGWPKAVAESMFYGVIPISTKISCLEWMLDNGNRGILIEPNIEQACNEILEHLNGGNLEKMSQEAQKWSQQYTLESLEEDIKNAVNE